MSQHDDSSNASEATTSSERLFGRVKWFNNKAGYGFITVTESGGDKAGKDVFAHHSAVTVASEQYKYLVMGEYVSFTWCVSDSDTHEFQAGDIRGVDGGFLMCETRNEQAKNRPQEEETGGRLGHGSTVHGGGRPFYVRGGRGPRENEEWMVVKRSTGGRTRGGHRNRGGHGGGHGGHGGDNRTTDSEDHVTHTNRYDIPEL